MYQNGSPINRTIGGEFSEYSDLAWYLRSWPDKLVSFVAPRLCDDDMAPFVAELYEYVCQADRDGPAFEEWCKE